MQSIIDDLCENGVNLNNRESLTNLMLNGPHHNLRKTVWLHATGALQLSRDRPEVYGNLLREEPLESVLEQIEKDLMRTFGSEGYFKQKKNYHSLKRILIAYSVRNPQVGYCQGMNLIAGRLLTIGFSEEESFWILVQIIECYLPIDYFSTLQGIKIDQLVFSYLLKKNLPSLSAHLSNLQVNENMYIPQLFLCIFAYSCPKKIVMRIWDIFFVKGSVVIFQVALAILACNKKEIERIFDDIEILQVLSNAGKKIKNEADIFGNKYFKSVTALEVRLLREHLKQTVEKSESSASFFSFQYQENFEVIEDYLDSKVYEQEATLNITM